MSRAVLPVVSPPDRVSADRALDEHRRAVAACRRCGHPEQIVPILSLAVRPRVMLVGQAPGKVEAAGGRPFAGRAGKQLFRWFLKAGLDEDAVRRRVYIAAVTRCFPGQNLNGRGDRVPSPDEQTACAPWLEAELRLIRPRVIIPVGRLAILRFLPVAPLEAIIGRAHIVRQPGGRSTVIPLPHPSGASSWIHQGNHPELLRRAIDLLREHVAPLVVPATSRVSA